MHNNSRLSVLFFTRKHRKILENVILYVRITSNGTVKEMSLNRDIPHALWGNNKKRGRGYSQNIQSLNKYLDQVYTKIHECHRQLLYENQLVTASAIRSKYLGDNEDGKTLLELVRYHNTTMHTSLKKGTMKNYGITERSLKLF